MAGFTVFWKTSQGRIIIGTVRVRVKFPGKEVPHK